MGHSVVLSLASKRDVRSVQPAREPRCGGQPQSTNFFGMHTQDLRDFNLREATVVAQVEYQAFRDGQLFHLLVKFGQNRQTIGIVARICPIEGPALVRIALLASWSKSFRVISSLANGHIEQNLSDFLEYQPEKPFDGLRRGRLQRGREAHPELAHNAFEIVAAFEGREIILKDRGGDAQQTIMSPLEQFPAGRGIATADAIDEELEVGRRVAAHVALAHGVEVRVRAAVTCETERVDCNSLTGFHPSRQAVPSQHV
jgi:hypothetical protein